MSSIKHQWVRYYNPRNKRVSVYACKQCGIGKGPISESVTCRPVADSMHHMKRLGWERWRTQAESS